MNYRKLLRWKGQLVEICLQNNAYFRYDHGEGELWFHPPPSMSFVAVINRLPGRLIDVLRDEIIIASFDHEDERNNALRIKVPKNRVRRINVFKAVGSIAV
jgi:hypothetical protein